MTAALTIVVITLLVTTTVFANRIEFQDRSNSFPSDFLFGVATAAYQTEGAWNVSGKSESIWDHMTHTDPDSIADHSNGDVACDSYNKLEEDVALLKDLGVNYYRFSLSWSRIIPDPLTNNVNTDAIAHYNQLIDLLVSNGIQPMVTIFHWDLPQSLQELGGFTSPSVINPYVNYARVVFENFGDRVKLWTTFNEPNVFCYFGYGTGGLAPQINQSGITDYLCSRNILLSHANAYHLYRREFKSKQKGKISMNFNCPWTVPASSSQADKDAANQFLQFFNAWFLQPVLKTGDYPSLMKKRIAQRSKAEGYLESRLPEFSFSEKLLIKGTADYVGLNHYNAFLAQSNLNSSEVSFNNDMGVIYFPNPEWPPTESPIAEVTPWALTEILKWIKDNFRNPDIYITENGYQDSGDINDTGRVDYLKQYLNATVVAINEYKVRVKGYTVWSFLDDFEWNSGYTAKYGLYYVNFTDPSRPRTPKASSTYFKQVIATKTP